METSTCSSHVSETSSGEDSDGWTLLNQKQRQKENEQQQKLDGGQVSKASSSELDLEVGTEADEAASVDSFSVSSGDGEFARISNPSDLSSTDEASEADEDDDDEAVEEEEELPLDVEESPDTPEDIEQDSLNDTMLQPNRDDGSEGVTGESDEGHPYQLRVRPEEDDPELQIVEQLPSGAYRVDPQQVARLLDALSQHLERRRGSSESQPPSEGDGEGAPLANNGEEDFDDQLPANFVQRYACSVHNYIHSNNASLNWWLTFGLIVATAAVCGLGAQPEESETQPQQQQSQCQLLDSSDLAGSTHSWLKKHRYAEQQLEQLKHLQDDLVGCMDRLEANEHKHLVAMQDMRRSVAACKQLEQSCAASDRPSQPLCTDHLAQCHLHVQTLREQVSAAEAVRAELEQERAAVAQCSSRLDETSAQHQRLQHQLAQKQQADNGARVVEQQSLRAQIHQLEAQTSALADSLAAAELSRDRLRGHLRQCTADRHQLVAGEVNPPQRQSPSDRADTAEADDHPSSSSTTSSDSDDSPSSDLWSDWASLLDNATLLLQHVTPQLKHQLQTLHAHLLSVESSVGKQVSAAVGDVWRDTQQVLDQAQQHAWHKLGEVGSTVEALSAYMHQYYDCDGRACMPCDDAAVAGSSSNSNVVSAVQLRQMAGALSSTRLYKIVGGRRAGAYVQQLRDAADALDAGETELYSADDEKSSATSPVDINRWLIAQQMYWQNAYAAYEQELDSDVWSSLLTDWQRKGRLNLQRFYNDNPKIASLVDSWPPARVPTDDDQPEEADWYAQRWCGRSEQRAAGQQADWLFERSRQRADQRTLHTQADWLFDRSQQRAAERQKPKPTATVNRKRDADGDDDDDDDEDWLWRGFERLKRRAKRDWLDDWQHWKLKHHTHTRT